MKKNSSEIIEAILQQYAPAVDERVREYLLQLLLQSDDYDDDDEDALIETVIQFLGDDDDDDGEQRNTSSQIVRALRSAQTLAATEIPIPPNVATQTTMPLQQQQQQTTASLLSQLAETTTTTPDEMKTAQKVRCNRIEQRKERRKLLQHEKTKSNPANNSNSNEATMIGSDHMELLELSTEDDSSAWKECLDQEQVWGGRGKGGRGAYAGRVNSVKSNIHLQNVSLSLNNGTELLTDTTMDIVRGHRYGLIGRNGVGKSTLLRRLADRAIPGMPHGMRVLLLEQQQQGIPIASEDKEDDPEQQQLSAVGALVRADVDRTNLLREQENIESALLQQELGTSADLTRAVERLSIIAAELDAIQADTAEDRAVEILKGLQFTDSMVHGPVANLSGGWRMRLALARVLFLNSNDILLFDEVSNHLDLHGLDWLINYINSSDTTLIVVSHDKVFLDAICTDIVVMEHQKLKYHVGNYSMCEQHEREKATCEGQILDAAERQRAKAQSFVQKQQAAANKKSADPNKQRQAKMIREKKMDRIGNYREDGKRYKLQSLKTLDEKSVRLAQKVQIEVDEAAIKMYFPNPTWPPSVGPNDTIVRMENLSFGYDADKMILNDVTLSLERGSKVALVGANGCGKTSLVKLISGEHKNVTTRGDLWIHPNLRIGHVTQYAIEELEAHADQTVVEYAETQLKSGQASASIVAKASGNVRQYLGAFGLGGKHALRQISNLSGGERMRLCFATVLAENPGLLCLDESTNHVDLQTLETMSAALNDFAGAVLMVSHNQAFLSGFCKELWVVAEDGHVTVNHSETESFDEIFSQYRSSVLQKVGTLSLSERRRQKASLAKRATTQRSGTQQNTALL